jgi:hypothetical protein
MFPGRTELITFWINAFGPNYLSKYGSGNPFAYVPIIKYSE